MVDHPKWPAGVVYVDLFAGPGVCKLRDCGRRIPGSPLVAAHAPKPFRKILLCERDPACADACEQRVGRIVPKNRFRVFRADCNEAVTEIARQIPDHALTLAFIDPEALDVSFETIRTLSSRGRVDLLILFADAFDVVRNVERVYYPDRDSKLDRFLGLDSDWRSDWDGLGNADGPAVRKLFAKIYQRQLKKHLGYRKFGEETIKSRNGPLYRLIYASKHSRGLDFWDKITRKDSSGQKEFSFE